MTDPNRKSTSIEDVMTDEEKDVLDNRETPNEPIDPLTDYPKHDDQDQNEYD
jgi:hypothetical protein